MDKPLKDQILISFFDAVQSCNKVIFSEQFYIIRIINSEGFYRLIRPSHSKRFCFIFSGWPNPHTLRPFAINFKTWNVPKKFNNWKNCSAELISDSTAVVSSAHCKIFVSSFSILIPLIHWFWRIAIARVSTSIIKR